MKRNMFIVVLTSTITLLIILIGIIVNRIYNNSIKIKQQKAYIESTNAKLTSAETSNNNDNNNNIAKEISVQKNDNNKKVDDRKEEINKKINLYGKNTSGIPVLMYHFFYDSSLKEKGIDNNYLEISKFEQHLKYLKENDYFFPTFEELELYIDGKLELPAKSIILTIDDGSESFFRLAIPVVEKYKVPITSFIITSACNYNIDDYKSEFVHFESHSDNMHRAGKNGKGLFVNLDYNNAYKDIQNSIKFLNSHDAFCYPFGHYNNLSKKVLKDSNFKVAFTTNAGKVKVKSDKFALPRVRISKDDTLNNFIAKIK